jgi:hypothetical protein
VLLLTGVEIRLAGEWAADAEVLRPRARRLARRLGLAARRRSVARARPHGVRTDHVISGVAERVGARIGSIVFVDAFVPDNGERLVDISAQATRDVILAAAGRGEISVPARPAAQFGVNEKDCAWVDQMCTPHPVATMVEKIAVAGAVDRIAKKAYVRAGNYPNPGFDAAFTKAKANPAWRTYVVPCGHDVMVDMPERLAEILEEVA